jgi:hypothetical protein
MEANQCRKCGGLSKPSKGIMNFHNIQTLDKTKEFETKILDCIKCESCGHSWIPNKTTREYDYSKLPMNPNPNIPNWMNGKTNQKQYSQEEVDRLLDKQAAETANQILKNSTYGANSKNHPINRKQFVEFNESLFQAYINKFNDEDLEKAKRLIEAKQILKRFK